MPYRRLALGLCAFFLFGIVACHRKAALDAAEARADLDRVCRAQRSYLETRKLMKTVSEAELARERAAHFLGDVKTSLVREAVAQMEREPAGRRRKPLDLAAEKAGAKDWRCPELDRL
jgi:hypothetical protein